MVQDRGYSTFVSCELAYPFLSVNVPVEYGAFEVPGQDLAFAGRIVCTEVLSSIVEVLVFKFFE